MENKTILIVDDTIENLDILIELLDNYNVMDATNGADALEIVDEEKIDLILLDIVMPDMDGFEVCSRVKANPNTKDIPIIFITANMDEESIEKAYMKGGVDYITKPFKPRELQARVKTHLELQELQNDMKNINKNLEIKIESELKKNKQQQLLMFQQSRLAQMGEIINMIAHQWRQPLNTLSMLNQTIVLKYTKGKLDTDVLDYFSENSNKQIQQMSKTIDSFRDFFKPEKEKTDYCINNIITHSIDMLNPVFSKHSLIVKYENRDKLYTNGFPNELGQALVNIINNAKDALIENMIIDKTIVLDLKEQGSKAIITIRDNAGGIPNDIVYNIFDPYFSTKEEKNGTGLGLYMTKLIIEEHMDGEIAVKNKDDGAEFTIILEMINI